jgi:hypothetical protein
MKMATKLIRPAAYAERRGLNKSTISRQIRAGTIPTHNGLIDPLEADAARKERLHQGRGRNTLEQRKRDRRTRAPEAEEMPQGYTAREVLDRLVLASGRIPEMALRLGLSMAQALAAADAFRSLVIILAGEIADSVYDWDWDDIPLVETDVAALAQDFNLTGDPGDWQREADAIGERIDLILWPWPGPSTEGGKEAAGNAVESR